MNYDINDVGKIITLDIQVLEHIKSYNQKSPSKNYYNKQNQNKF